MVVEKFRGGPGAVRRRFLERGRLFGSRLTYVSSWMAADGQTCYQLMEAPEVEAFESWIAAWADLVDFEIYAVTPSAEFWEAWPAR